MGWLFACFGYSNKRKRPKKASKFGPKSRQRIRSYQPLESDVPQEFGVSKPNSSSTLELRDGQKEEKKAKIRKKVRFNLEVIVYEPIPADVSSSNSEDEVHQNWGKIEEEEDSSYSSTSTHRYNNCCDYENEYSYEDDDVQCEVSDLDYDDEKEDNDDDDCLFDPRKVYYEEVAEEHQDESCMPLNTLGDSDLGINDGSTRNIRFRSHYIFPVLNPIENLSQWKALKARKCN